VSDCILDSRGAGVRIGFFNDIVRRVIVHDCRITAQRGILVSARNRGMVEQVSVHDCRVATRLFTGNWWGCGEPFQVSGLGAGGGHIRDVELAQLDCRSEHGAILYADDAFRIEDVRVRNCRLRLQNSRHAATLGGHFDLRPRSEEKSLPSGYFAHAIPGIYARNIAGLHLRECRVDFPPEPAPYFGRSVQMEGCSGARAEGCSEA
jgi:hypothetical protein